MPGYSGTPLPKKLGIKPGFRVRLTDAPADVRKELRDALANTPYQIELYHESFETVLFPDPVMQQEFRDSYVRKYRDRRPDLIIAFGPSPLKFLAESHEKFFTDIPIVFGGAAREEVDDPVLLPPVLSSPTW